MTASTASSVYMSTETQPDSGPRAMNKPTTVRIFEKGGPFFFEVALIMAPRLYGRLFFIRDRHGPFIRMWACMFVAIRRPKPLTGFCPVSGGQSSLSTGLLWIGGRQWHGRTADRSCWPDGLKIDRHQSAGDVQRIPIGVGPTRYCSGVGLLTYLCRYRWSRCTA